MGRCKEGQRRPGISVSNNQSNRSNCSTTYNRESTAHGSEASGLAGLLEVGDRGEIRLGYCNCVSELDRFLGKQQRLIKAYAQSK